LWVHAGPRFRDEWGGAFLIMATKFQPIFRTPTGCCTTEYCDPAPSIVIPANALPDGAEGVAYSYTLIGSPTGGEFTSGALPDGLSLSAAGVLSGTPSAAGDYDIEVTYTFNEVASTITIQLTITA
jgi:hypothetical protein